ncbi:conserved hypothetical protein [Nitrosococcus halophilus Nc 4]|uniref:Coiled coil domain-containing protein n=1 Tax=Nitrosococcus halophilus (strain Nc4) TaxID=472759 RepID=D5C1V0_NITHN|nr:hypothetical protein [Nitrosococcus halophilus]ADE14733.1 conserved hypothetical protein [Nitrosococcus halophilus Nc 4]
MSTKEALIDKFKAQLKQIDAEMDKLKAVSEEAAADVKLREDKEKLLSTLQEKRNAFEAKIEQISRSSEQASDDLKNDLEKTWQDLKSAVHRATQ